MSAQAERRFQSAPAVVEYDWQEVDDKPHQRRLDIEGLTLFLTAQRRPGPPRTPWLPTSDTDGGGWTFLLSAHAGGDGVTTAFYAVSWAEAKSVALAKARDAARRFAATEALGG